MKRTFSYLAVLFFMGNAAQAATMFQSNFDGNLISSATASSIVWTTGTGVTMNNGGDITSNNGYEFVQFGNDSNANSLTIDESLDTSPAITRSISFQFNLSETYSLTSALVISGLLDGSGNDNSGTANLAIIITPHTPTIFETEVVDYGLGGSSFQLNSFTAISGVTLAPGDYTMTVGINNSTALPADTYAAYDGVALYGTVIPEPSSLTFLGLGAFGLLRRRR